MCFCEKPTRNDEQQGWNSEAFAPALSGDDALVYDECGRCQPQVNGTGSVDYHSHHFRLVTSYGMTYLLVRHGGGDERVSIGYSYMRVVELLEPMDSDRRYLMLHALYSIHKNASMTARNEESCRWQTAAAEKRIRTRKLPAQKQVKVWIEPIRQLQH